MEHYCLDCGHIETNDCGQEFTCPICESANVQHVSTEKGENE
jgi:Zn finger protein HypA/HybF involved in hydrogenase expression